MSIQVLIRDDLAKTVVLEDGTKVCLLNNTLLWAAIKYPDGAIEKAPLEHNPAWSNIFPRTVPVIDRIKELDLVGQSIRNMDSAEKMEWERTRLSAGL